MDAFFVPIESVAAARLHNYASSGRLSATKIANNLILFCGDLKCVGLQDICSNYFLKSCTNLLRPDGGNGTSIWGATFVHGCCYFCRSFFKLLCGLQAVLEILGIRTAHSLAHGKLRRKRRNGTVMTFFVYATIIGRFVRLCVDAQMHLVGLSVAH